MFSASFSSKKLRLTMLKIALPIRIVSGKGNKLPEEVFLPFHYQVNNQC
jgi:hypothetical protein